MADNKYAKALLNYVQMPMAQLGAVFGTTPQKMSKALRQEGSNIYDSMKSAVTAPSRALQGQMNPQMMMDENGNIYQDDSKMNQEAMNLAMNMANGGLGSSAINPSPKGSLGMTSIKNSSKYVMDETGKPLTLYHGGPKFEGQFKTPEHADKGIYFTDNPYLAQDQFALQHELAMRDKTGVGYNDVPEHMLDSGEWDPKYFKFADVKKVNLKMNNPKIMDSLDAKAIPNLYGQGHDGFIVKSTGDFGYKGGQYVVLDPNQIEFIK